ncbi:hypothetical protein [Kiloniella sp. b19]|uniref:hypothetical protein n=1 Tax=Kiloniella sp. GXU_MW_B19 TaxID=3141326 RepID=UPI0031E2ECF8
MDIVNYMQFITALLFVIALIALVSVIVRKTGITLPGMINTTPHGSKRDVQVVESSALDSKRRLSVIRWRGEDHLILTGGMQDLHLSTRPAEPEKQTGTSQKVQKTSLPEELLRRTGLKQKDAKRDNG